MSADTPTAPDARRFAGAALCLALLAAALIAARRTAPERPVRLEHRIDLNTADAALLSLLPDIGPARAAAIVADREAHGPYESIADLDRVPGVGPRTIEGLMEHATVADPRR